MKSVISYSQLLKVSQTLKKCQSPVASLVFVSVMFVFFLSHNSPQQTHCVSKTASIRAKEGRHADDDDGLLEEHRFNEKPKSEKGIEHDDDDDDHHHRHIVVV